MNIINQASNLITGDSMYDLIYTINITCMMVLASVYLSVSESLPVSPDIKPIEQWLLFNLFWPFLVIISNILVQVYRYNISSQLELATSFPILVITTDYHSTTLLYCESFL